MGKKIKKQLDHIETVLNSQTQMLTELVSLLKNNNVQLSDFHKNQDASIPFDGAEFKRGKTITATARQKPTMNELNERLDRLI
ncbi:hypothetical protein HT747_04160 [Brevibacillus borstelensis]|jgi:hypothetical protein|uniref:hypothetical protein n=1 Tax=Brevibacillus borstelensis TaxID=45462 RepID=UPI00156278C5|nr:hypothetical protein [Brevibacillus borstelensis]MBE5394355.1 hypothetical protein [Brevibacillus borstelensis]